MQVDVSLNSVQHSPDFEFTWKIDFQMGNNVYHMCSFYMDHIMVHSIHTEAVDKGLKSLGYLFLAYIACYYWINWIVNSVSAFPY